MATSNLGFEFTGPGRMELVEIGAPPSSLPRGHALLQTLCSGVTNGTERHALLGEHGWNQFPGRHGYQHVARVVGVGPETRHLQEGDLLFLGQYVGHRAWNLVDTSLDFAPGSVSLYIRLPSDSDPVRHALMGVAGVSVRCARRIRIAPAERVWVAGLGVIGQFAAQAARAFGAHVTVTDPRPERVLIAQELGAHVAITSTDTDAAERLRKGGPYNAIVDCSGAESILRQIHQDRLLAHGGRIALLAVRSETTFPWSMLHGTEASIEVSCHFGADDLRVLLYFMEQGVIRTEPLITHVAPVEQAPEVYNTLRDRPGDLLGVVFDWRG